MDGRVLHFAAEEQAGLIRGSDGHRYPFAAPDWRSPQPPAAGDGVDFDVAEGRAVEIFLVAQAPTAPARPREDATNYVKRRPALVFAVLILTGCMLPFLSVPFFSMTLFSLPSTASFFVNLAGAFGGNAEPGIAGVRAAVSSLYLLYAIPAAAGWLIFRELGGAATRRLSLVVGIVGLATPFVTSAVSSSIARASVPRRASGTQAEIPNPVEAMLQMLSYIGIGWMLIALASAGLVALGCGWSPFGTREGRD
ncbi:MAG: hypothetical protein QOI38_464 [Sphingomonadales bacterium]|jgi:hypothetical protein|nr:hypothetical protein [Sphingomonadales bacterium]